MRTTPLLPPVEWQQHRVDIILSYYPRLNQSRTFATLKRSRAVSREPSEHPLEIKIGVRNATAFQIADAHSLFQIPISTPARLEPTVEIRPFPDIFGIRPGINLRQKLLPTRAKPTAQPQPTKRRTSIIDRRRRSARLTGLKNHLPNHSSALSNIHISDRSGDTL